MTATRKLPHSLTKDGRMSSRGENLLPELSETPTGFVGIKSGKKFERGFLVYLGRDVTPEMMLEVFCQRRPHPADCAAALRRLDAFVLALHAYKIGNVLSISYSSDGLPLLKLEQEFLLSGPDKRLP